MKLLEFADSYTIFDTETTGLGYYNDIIEIGALKVVDDKIVDSFETFIALDRMSSVPRQITKITGINDKMLEGAPNIKTALDKFLEFIKDDILVAHNASFDYGMVNDKLRRLYGTELKNDYIDTLKMSRMTFPELKSHKLELLKDYLDIHVDISHRALDDCKTLYELYKKMKVTAK